MDYEQKLMRVLNVKDGLLKVLELIASSAHIDDINQLFDEFQKHYHSANFRKDYGFLNVTNLKEGYSDCLEKVVISEQRVRFCYRLYVQNQDVMHSQFVLQLHSLYQGLSFIEEYLVSKR